MATKKERRIAAQKKAQKTKMTIMAVVAICVVAIIAGTIIYTITRPDSRVFAVSGGQSVTLYENGRFTARLFHNFNANGTFVEDESTGVISFTHGGNTVSTQIENDVLILPVQWRAACRVHSHEIEFPLAR